MPLLGRKVAAQISGGRMAGHDQTPAGVTSYRAKTTVGAGDGVAIVIVAGLSFSPDREDRDDRAFRRVHCS